MQAFCWWVRPIGILKYSGCICTWSSFDSNDIRGSFKGETFLFHYSAFSIPGFSVSPSSGAIFTSTHYTKQSSPAHRYVVINNQLSTYILRSPEQSRMPDKVSRNCVASYLYPLAFLQMFNHIKVDKTKLYV